MVWRLYDWGPRGGQNTITEHSTLLTESMQHLTSTRGNKAFWKLQLSLLHRVAVINQSWLDGSTKSLLTNVKNIWKQTFAMNFKIFPQQIKSQHNMSRMSFATSFVWQLKIILLNSKIKDQVHFRLLRLSLEFYQSQLQLRPMSLSQMALQVFSLLWLLPVLGFGVDYWWLAAIVCEGCLMQNWK